jgi:hypothetical protein
MYYKYTNYTIFKNDLMRREILKYFLMFIVLR